VRERLHERFDAVRRLKQHLRCIACDGSLHGAAPIEWPESTIGSASTIRGEYLEAVRQADKCDYSALLALHERFASR
jgi:hypothetical protein